MYIQTHPSYYEWIHEYIYYLLLSLWWWIFFIFSFCLLLRGYSIYLVLRVLYLCYYLPLNKTLVILLYFCFCFFFSLLHMCYWGCNIFLILIYWIPYAKSCKQNLEEISFITWKFAYTTYLATLPCMHLRDRERITSNYILRFYQLLSTGPFPPTPPPNPTNKP